MKKTGKKICIFLLFVIFLADFGYVPSAYASEKTEASIFEETEGDPSEETAASLPEESVEISDQYYDEQEEMTESGEVWDLSTFSGTEIEDAWVGQIPDQMYIGEAIMPEPFVKDGDKVLVRDRDFILEYQNHINAGTAAVIIRGQNNYTGSLKRSFKITARDAFDVRIKPVASQSYTGKAVTPSLDIRYGGKKLKQGTDYTPSYSNNVRMGKGTAKVRIRFKGNFKGSQTIRFSILPAGTVPVAKVTSGTVKLTWKKAVKANGYRIYRRNQKNTEWTYLGETSGLSYTDGNRNPDTSYSYAVRTYIKQGGKRFYSGYQNIKIRTKKNKSLLSCKITEPAVLRGKPSANGKRIRSLSRGDTVKIVRGYLKRKNGHSWYKVKNKKGYGYIVSEAVEKQERFPVKSNVEFRMSADRRAGIDKALGRFKSRGIDVSFVMWDCKTDAIFYYNRDRRFFTASVIKAPYIVYVMQNYVETGKAGMKSTKFRRGNYKYQGGTGTMKNDGAGTVYTLEEVIRRTIRKSDNIGYTMLRRRFGTKNYKNWLRKAGVRTSVSSPDYPNLSAMEFAKVWKYTYGYLNKQTRYSEWLKKEFAKSGYSFMRPAYKGKYTVCSKPGIEVSTYNEAGIVMSGEYPYVVAILSTAPGWHSPTIKKEKADMAALVRQMDALHREYIKAIR